MVKSSKDDLVSSSDQTHSGQQLQNQGFGPADANKRTLISRNQTCTKYLVLQTLIKHSKEKLRIPDTTLNQSRHLQEAGQMVLLVLWLANYRGIIPPTQGAIH